MSRIPFSAPYNDEAIVAWLDGEMSEVEREAFDQHLNSDSALAARTAELMHSNLPWQQAFEPLLDDAPEARMQAKLDTLLQPQPASSVAAKGISRRNLIAASLGFLAVGVLTGRFLLPQNAEVRGEPKVRELIAQYMSLYSTETLADIDATPTAIQRGLNRMHQDLGLSLADQTIQVPGTELKSVRMLRYDSTSIAQIAYLHPDYGPMALCVSRAAGEASSSLNHEVRRGLNLVWWHQKGYQYVLIGHNPPDDLEKSGRLLQQRIA
ncbi:hypothetical protein PMPD1_0186 [Paramixta manurensis]|uniref:Putative zinc-finger domain-containing protein n=1 Tax=Paramixta manurensis TaxID=2740817 RepID=A0A6M8U6I3_9GAMM|nr:hypothetical protein PMPD1_0186 [Erwiniaceae bacterium PD-1]